MSRVMNGRTGDGCWWCLAAKRRAFSYTLDRSRNCRLKATFSSHSGHGRNTIERNSFSLSKRSTLSLWERERGLARPIGHRRALTARSASYDPVFSPGSRSPSLHFPSPCRTWRADVNRAERIASAVSNNRPCIQMVCYFLRCISPKRNT